MGRASRETPSIQSLDRGLTILEAVARIPEPVSLGRLTELLGVDRSSAFRLANTLKRRGFLTKPSGGKDYILGPAIWRLARQFDWAKTLITVCHEPLKLLAKKTNEAAHLAVREGTRGLVIDEATTTHMVAVSGLAGELVPAYCTAHGKALLADFDLTGLEALFGPGPLHAYTERTITSTADLAKECSQIKEQGFITDDEEFHEGIRAVAAPVRDKDGGVIAAIGVAAPKSRFPDERCAECAKHVCATAGELTALVGE
jgi:DNA-binding IclR family transcriptional regulator